MVHRCQLVRAPNRTENRGSGADNNQITPAERLLCQNRVKGLESAEHSNHCSSPNPLGLEWRLIYPSLKGALVRPLRQREKEKELHLLKYRPGIKFCYGFLSPGPLGVCRAALCKMSSCLWAPRCASTPKTWRSSSGGISLEAPPPFSCHPGLEVASSHLRQLGDHTCCSRSQAALLRPRPLRLLP